LVLSGPFTAPKPLSLESYHPLSATFVHFWDSFYTTTPTNLFFFPAARYSLFAQVVHNCGNSRPLSREPPMFPHVTRRILKSSVAGNPIQFSFFTFFPSFEHAFLASRYPTSLFHSLDSRHFPPFMTEIFFKQPLCCLVALTSQLSLHAWTSLISCSRPKRLPKPIFCQCTFVQFHPQPWGRGHLHAAVFHKRRLLKDLVVPRHIF
jgi:hypothetical protein